VDSEPFRLFPYQAIVDRPRVTWPNGARVAVWVIPNIEHFHIEIGDHAPDIRNHSRRDYGNRVGVWRIIEVLAKHGVRGTVALNAEVGRFYPRIMEEVTKLKWELMGHGLTNSVLLTGMPKDEESALIAEVHEAIGQWGQTMRGWLGPGLSETWHTLDLLRESGVEYVCDWVNDDLPYRMNNGLY
jgi:allantoinase